MYGERLLSTYYARKCLEEACYGATQPPCRSQPYAMAGAPENFQDFLQCAWTNGDVSTASNAAEQVGGSLAVDFELSWDSVAGHGQTGPGGFNIDPADGSVPAAVPQKPATRVQIARLCRRAAGLQPLQTAAAAARLWLFLASTIAMLSWRCFALTSAPPIELHQSRFLHPRTKSAKCLHSRLKAHPLDR